MRKLILSTHEYHRGNKWMTFLDKLSICSKDDLNTLPMYLLQMSLLESISNEKGYDNQWRYVDTPLKITLFYHVYDNQYVKNVVKPYNIAFISTAIFVIKANTPILDDNICDILSFLNDEKYFTKHQIDSVIYDMA